MTDTDTDADFREGGYRFDDLKRARIVSSRSDLHDKQRKHGFPKPVKLGDESPYPRLGVGELNKQVKLARAPEAVPGEIRRPGYRAARPLTPYEIQLAVKARVARHSGLDSTLRLPLCGK